MRNAPQKKTSRNKKPITASVVSIAPVPATFPIVAIGAAAGGLDAFSNLLRALPPTPGLALIFIPHLDPTHESATVELLSRTTNLPVHQASEGMRVLVNFIYVLPPDSDMTISDGTLHLIRREGGRGHRMPIDTFLRSLADDQASNAVGVILSGTTNDGAVGLAAIKDAAGITFAQDPRTAKYDRMPQSAISSGAVDYVLPSDEIAQGLIRVRKQPSNQQVPDDAFDGKDHLMKDIFRLLKNFSKVDFVDYKVATIRRRILRRMNINQIDELLDYVKLLHPNAEEVEALYRDVLINVTSFFRNPEVFDSLREVVYPKILADRSPNEPVRVWVPGCSTGEETYSHAISLVEALSELRIELPIQIFGTDLSETAIQKARAGLYKESIASEVSEVRLRRFFHKVPGGYQISKSIRDTCVFARRNVFR